MFLAATTDILQLVTSATCTVDVHVSYADRSSDGATIGANRQNTGITTATTTTILAAPAASTHRAVRFLSVRNRHASTAVDVTVVFDQNSTDFELIRVTLAAGETLQFRPDTGFVVVTPRQVSISPAALTVVRLASDDASSSTTPTEVSGLTATLVAGTYVYQYTLIYQSAATTTGIRLSVNFTGTTTRHVYNQMWSDVSATASTAVPDQDNIGAAGHVMGSFASRANSTAGRGVTLSVDTANADMLMVVEGILIAGGSGDLELWHGSEVAAAANTIMAGSSLYLVLTG